MFCLTLHVRSKTLASVHTQGRAVKSGRKVGGGHLRKPPGVSSHLHTTSDYSAATQKEVNG